MYNTDKRNRDITYRSMMTADLSEGCVDYADPLAYAAATGPSNPDTLRHHKAMSEPDWEEFRDSALKEIKTLEELGTWKEIPRSQVTAGKRVLDGTWVFSRKRFPDGKLRKLCLPQ
jgi:hypothetical protein